MHFMESPQPRRGPRRSSAAAARRPEPSTGATGQGRDVIVVSSRVSSRGGLDRACLGAHHGSGLPQENTHGRHPTHGRGSSLGLNVRQGHVRSMGREGDAGPPAKLMGTSCPAGRRGGQEPRVSQNSREALGTSGTSGGAGDPVPASELRGEVGGVQATQTQSPELSPDPWPPSQVSCLSLWGLGERRACQQRRPP